MVRDRGWRNALQRHNIPAIDLLLGGNSLEDSETGLIPKSFGDFFNLRAVHKFFVVYRIPGGHASTALPGSQAQKTCNLLIRHSSKYRN